MTPIGAIAFEIWFVGCGLWWLKINFGNRTMQSGILFDNVLIATDEAEAADFSSATFGVTSKLEKRKEAGSAIGGKL